MDKFVLSVGEEFTMDVKAFWYHAAQKFRRNTNRPQDVLIDAPICEATHSYIVARQAVIDELVRENEELRAELEYREAHPEFYC